MTIAQMKEIILKFPIMNHHIFLLGMCTVFCHNLFEINYCVIFYQLLLISVRLHNYQPKITVILCCINIESRVQCQFGHYLLI
jgi:hypothetical protein